jgi:hypothetical protein
MTRRSLTSLTSLTRLRLALKHSKHKNSEESVLTGTPPSLALHRGVVTVRTAFAYTDSTLHRDITGLFACARIARS